MRIFSLALLCGALLMSGCADMHPLVLADVCAREEMVLATKTNGRTGANPEYRRVIDAKCVDDARHRETAKNTVTVNKEQARYENRYDARNGNDRLTASTTYDRRRGGAFLYRTEAKKKGEGKFFFEVRTGRMR